MPRQYSSRCLALALGALLAVAVVSAACGGAGAPTVPPTPIPTPIPTPTPTPDPNVPPAGSGCRKPYPPPVTRFNVKIHMKDYDYWVIDSTPLVGPDTGYCARIGFPDRTICPIRAEGADDREACELWRVGTARDTGKPGPTWTITTKDGTTSYCTGPTGACEHHPSGPFTVMAYSGGLYKACSEAGACGEVDVDRGL